MLEKTNGDLVIEQVFSKLLKKLIDKDFRKNTVELINVHLAFDPNQKYIDYGTIKKASRKYIANEIAWYVSKDKSILGHPSIETNPVWKSIATKEGLVNSNYGNILFSELHDGKSQLDYAVEKLIQDKYSRQSLVIYTRPSIQYEFNDGIHANSDFICTTHTQHFINNNNEFDYIVNMRSNDAIFGLQNDYSWHQYVYTQMFNKLVVEYPDLKPGKIYWNAGSMHIYERHYELLKDICKEYVDKKQNKKENLEVEVIVNEN